MSAQLAFYLPLYLPKVLSIIKPITTHSNLDQDIFIYINTIAILEYLQIEYTKIKLTLYYITEDRGATQSTNTTPDTNY